MTYISNSNSTNITNHITNVGGITTDDHQLLLPPASGWIANLSGLVRNETILNDDNDVGVGVEGGEGGGGGGDEDGITTTTTRTSNNSNHYKLWFATPTMQVGVSLLSFGGRSFLKVCLLVGALIVDSTSVPWMAWCTLSRMHKMPHAVQQALAWAWNCLLWNGVLATWLGALCIAIR